MKPVHAVGMFSIALLLFGHPRSLLAQSDEPSIALIVDTGRSLEVVLDQRVTIKRVGQAIATVTNRHGELVTNLDQPAFTVFENGRPQPITLFRRDDVPVSIGLVIDNSGSMRDLRPHVEAAALAFARASRRGLAGSTRLVGPPSVTP